jgi:hypothetical protein
VEEVTEVVDSIDVELKTQHSQKVQQNIYIDIYAEMNKGDGRLANILLERWHIESMSYKDRVQKRRGYGAVHELHPSEAYRKAVVMMRSLYTELIILPTHKLYQKTRKHKNSGTVIKYIIYGKQAKNDAFEEGMRLHFVLTILSGASIPFKFDAIDIGSQATIQLNVVYRKNIAGVLNAKQDAHHIQDVIINDYFDSGPRKELLNITTVVPQETIQVVPNYQQQRETTQYTSKYAQELDSSEEDIEPVITVVDIGPFGGPPPFSTDTSAKTLISINDSYRNSDFSESNLRVCDLFFNFVKLKLDFSPPREEPLSEYTIPSFDHGMEAGSQIGLITQFANVPSVFTATFPPRQDSAPQNDVIEEKLETSREQQISWDFTPDFISSQLLTLDSETETDSDGLAFTSNENATVGDVIHMLVSLRNAPTRLQSTENRGQTASSLIDELDELRLHRKEMLTV